MDQIYVKYNNLKQFILSIDDKNEWCTWFQDIGYEQFHLTVKSKLSNNMTADDIYKDIINTSKIEAEKINKDQETKLKRYILYFTEIGKIM
jgi:hypothetical protein